MRFSAVLNLLRRRSVGGGRGVVGRFAAGMAVVALSAGPALAVTVAISPTSATVAPTATRQFTATVSGASDSSVKWLVDGVAGGAPSLGTISSAGLYTPPKNPDAATSVVVTAVSKADATALASAAVTAQIYTRTGNVFYVAPTGVDTRANASSGSSAAPWKTIQYAANQVAAGDTVVVKTGTYKEAVTITRGGSLAGGYVTFVAATGETPVIDGVDITLPATGMSGLVTIKSVDDAHPVNFVRFKGFTIRNFKSNTSYIAIGVLVTGVGDQIDVRNNVIDTIQANGPASASPCALGIAVYGLSASKITNVIVEGNELQNLRTGLAEALTFSGNVEKWQATNNIVHDTNFIGIDATGYYNAGAANPENDRARQGWIADNVVYNISTAGNQALTFSAAAIGIYVDGGRDITIERNKVDSAEGGVWLLSEKPGKFTSNVTARDNLLRFSTGAGVLLGGYSSSVGGVENSTVVNNTLYYNNNTTASGVTSGELQISYNVNNVVFANNILYAGQKNMAIAKFSPANASTVTLGYNVYLTTQGAGPTSWYWINTTYMNSNTSGNTFAQFKTVSGDYNNQSLVADPQFMDLANLDMRLKATSPAVNSGFYAAPLGLPSVGRLDYAKATRLVGSSIDRGAYERQ